MWLEQCGTTESSVAIYRNMFQRGQSLTKLFLYSDQVIPENDRLNQRLMTELAVRDRTIGYIGSSADPDQRFIAEKRRYYATYGVAIPVACDLDEKDRTCWDGLFKCGAIHLSGGDTRSFLTRLRRAGLISRLRQYARDGGVIVGTSAGAILLTPCINTDALFSGADPSEATDVDALNLTPFEFFPHLNTDASFLPALLNYSRCSTRPILACPDGSGAIVSTRNVETIGDCVWFRNGRMRPSTNSTED